MATRIKLHNAGFRELRTMQATRDRVHEEAEALGGAVGDPSIVADTEVPRNRARSAVIVPGFMAEDLIRALGSRMGR